MSKKKIEERDIKKVKKRIAIQSEKFMRKFRKER